MHLLNRFNVVFAVAFALARWLAHEVFTSMQRSHARREVLAATGLMLDGSLASRSFSALLLDCAAAAELDSPEDRSRLLRLCQ